jgi:cytochrome c
VNSCFSPVDLQAYPTEHLVICHVEVPLIVEEFMKKVLFLGAVAALISGPVLANADLAKSKNCMACHAVDKKVVGPAYKDVAAKYAGQKDAEDKLVQKVLKGSKGVWGEIPMPPNSNVSEAEARTLVKWVLNQK